MRDYVLIENFGVPRQFFIVRTGRKYYYIAYVSVGSNFICKEVIMSEREERFERMMQSVLDSYNSAVEKMNILKQEGKTNTVTYKQLMAEKLKNQNMISLYKLYGLLEE